MKMMKLSRERGSACEGCDRRRYPTDRESAARLSGRAWKRLSRPRPRAATNCSRSLGCCCFIPGGLPIRSQIGLRERVGPDRFVCRRAPVASTPGGETVDLGRGTVETGCPMVSVHRPVGIACRAEVDPTFKWRPEKAVTRPWPTSWSAMRSNTASATRAPARSPSLNRTPAELVRLTVADDGSGLQPGVDPEHINSLGLSIARAFA